MVPLLRLNGSLVPPDQRPSFYGIIMKKYVLALLFILPVSATLSSVFNSENVVYADSSTPLCTFTFTDTLPDPNTQYCSEHLSDIHYVLIDFGVDSTVHAMSAGFNTFNLNNNGGRVSYIWEYSTMPYSYIQNANGISAEYPLTFSFYADFPGASCPEPEPCPTCPDCDDNIIAQLFKSTFWNVATSLVALIVPVLALFLIFRLVHDFFWGKG